MEIRREPDSTRTRRVAWTSLATVLGLVLVAGLSLALVRSPARALSADSSSIDSPTAETVVVTSQIRSPNRDAYITQKPPMTIEGIAWREGSDPPYVTGDVYLHVERTTESAYLLLWDPVPSASYYLVEEASDPEFSETTTVYYGSDTEFPHTQDEGTFYYRAKADASGVGSGRWSNVVSVTVPWVASATGDSTLSASEATLAVDSPITVQVRIDDGDWHNATVSETTWGAEWWYEWSSMPEERDTEHTIQTRADGGDGFGPTDTITITLDNKTYVFYMPIIFKRWPPINYPPSLTVSGLENGQDEDGEYLLSWTYSDDNPAVPDPDFYTLQESTNSDFSSPTEYTPLTTTSKQFTDKDDGTYYYRVRGNNEYGAGEWSNVVSVTVVSHDFYDDFSSSSSGWLTHKAKCCLSGCDDGIRQQHPDYKYSLFYDDGRYHVNIPLDCRAGGKHGDTRHIYPVVFAPDVERPTTKTCIELKGDFEKSDPYWSFWGLVFAASDDKSTVYSLEVNNFGDWAVVKRTGYDFPGPNAPWQNENRSYLVAYTGGRRDPARPAFKGNRLKAEIDGRNVKLYINGQMVHKFSSSEVKSLTNVGIIGGDWEITPTQIGFDHFYLDEGCDSF